MRRAIEIALIAAIAIFAGWQLLKWVGRNLSADLRRAA